MNNKKNIGCLIGLIIVGLIIAGLIGLYVWKGPPTFLTAKEVYNKALEHIKAQGDEAFLVSLAEGYIPESIGRVSDYERTGKSATSWFFCFYSKEKDEWIKLTTTWKGEIKETDTSLYSCISKNKIDSEKWKIDSQEAINIAKSRAEEEGKKRFIPIKIELYQSKEGPIWSIIFFPPNVGKDTVGFSVTINGETGEIIRTGEPGYHYLVI